MGLIVIFIAVVVWTIKSRHDYPIQIDIVVDESIDTNKLKIIINPHGYILKGYEPDEYIGRTDQHILLYKGGVIQNYSAAEINSYSDYYIYAKYQNQYAKMKYTNQLVLGDKKNLISINLNKIKNMLFLSSTPNPPMSIDSIADASFKDLKHFQHDPLDSKMFAYLDRF